MDIFINDTWQNMQTTKDDYSKLQGDLNFAFDQRESEVNLHKVTSLPESPCCVSPAIITIKQIDLVENMYIHIVVNTMQFHIY